MTEKEFHSSRRAFAVLSTGVIYCPSSLSHHEWLVDSHVMGEEDFKLTIRGYVDETGIYFYRDDFITDKVVESVALQVCDEIATNVPVYCGVIKGKVGERWKPIKRIK